MDQELVSQSLVEIITLFFLKYSSHNQQKVLFDKFLLWFHKGCVAEMRNVGQSHQVCDGVVDCPDFSDELYCPYCPEHHFHCGVGKMCIPKTKMCDGIVDCDNGADEKGCCKYFGLSLVKVNDDRMMLACLTKCYVQFREKIVLMGDCI